MSAPSGSGLPSPPRGRQIVAIGGTGSNAGKTTVAEAVIRAARARGRRVAALKVTRAHVHSCPREVDTCGVCDSLAAPFELVTEAARLAMPGKDTGRYVLAGADLVAWLLVQPASLQPGLAAALAALDPAALLVAEGNSFLEAGPAAFAVMVVGRHVRPKPSALAVARRIDLVAASGPLSLSRAREFRDAWAPDAPVIPAGEVAEAVLARLA
jgi:molybdopterin-guanine dinucleotide biosynthesis protein